MTPWLLLVGGVLLVVALAYLGRRWQQDRTQDRVTSRWLDEQVRGRRE